MHESNCVFCNDQDKILENYKCFTIYDRFPVNKGHMLVIPKRHFSNYFDSTKEELGLNRPPSFRHQSSLRSPPFDDRINLMPLSIKYLQISRHSRAAGGSPNPPQRSMVSTRRQKSGGKFRLITSRLNSMFRTFSKSGRQRAI